MKIAVETTKGLGRKLTIQVPIKEINDEKEKRIKKIAKTAKLDGFRPGKVPAKVIENKYGASVQQEAMTHVISSTLLEALAKENLHPAGQPKIEITKFDPEKPTFEYTAEFEIYPKITPKSLEGVTVETITSEITEEDVNKAIENLRKYQIEWIEVERPSQKEDQVILDFEGFMDNEPFEGGKANNAPIVLGSNTMIPGFEDGIIGKKKGEEFEIEVKFPENYFNKDLSGKSAKFKIKLHKVSESKLPELDDEFIKKLGIEGNLDELKNKMKEMLTHELKDILEHKNKKILLDKLLEINKFDVPKSLIETEIESLRNQAKQRMMQYTKTKPEKTPEMPKELFEEEATRRIKLFFIIRELSELYNITAAPEKIKEIIKDIARNYKDPEKVISWYYEDEERLGQAEMMVIEKEVTKKLFETAKIKEKQISFDELIKTQNSQQFL